jgi:putative addiction module component (TIGR02574 family)
MSKTLAEVTDDAAELPGSERLKLARILLELSERDLEFGAGTEDSWDKEIERRLVELRSGKVRGVPLREVKRRIKERLNL